MIQVHVGLCACCGSKICQRCACCHAIACDERLRFCRGSHRDEKHGGHRVRFWGVQRRLRGKFRVV